jgi:hypothetical protein
MTAIHTRKVIDRARTQVVEQGIGLSEQRVLDVLRLPEDCHFPAQSGLFSSPVCSASPTPG